MKRAMMSSANYHKLLSIILDLPSLGLVMQEAPGKLAGTIMLVNGNLTQVNKVREEGLVLGDEGNPVGALLPGDQITSLEVWLPRTGIYSEKEGRRKVFLQRVPYRQWRRSFHPSFYSAKWLPTNFGFLNVDPQSRVEYWSDAAGNVWYMTNKVAVFQNDYTLICLDSRFEQELRDFVRDNPFALTPPKGVENPSSRVRVARPSRTTYMETPF